MKYQQYRQFKNTLDFKLRCPECRREYTDKEDIEAINDWAMCLMCNKLLGEIEINQTELC